VVVSEQNAAPAPAGWYPDPNAPGGQRWWDGTQWTEHVGQQASTYQPFQPPKAPEGTTTNTVWVWLVVLLPLLSIASLFTIDLAGYMRTVMADPTDIRAQLSIYTSPGYLLTTLGSFVVYALSVVFSALDHRELVRREVPKPFHWAFAFLGGLVYVIGRSVVVKRRTGGGLAPLWGVIAVFVVSVIATIAWTIWLLDQIFASFPGYVYS
jgi:hypothetical protein